MTYTLCVKLYMGCVYRSNTSLDLITVVIYNMTEHWVDDVDCSCTVDWTVSWLTKSKVSIEIRVKRPGGNLSAFSKKQQELSNYFTSMDNSKHCPLWSDGEDKQVLFDCIHETNWWNKQFSEGSVMLPRKLNCVLRKG